MKSLLDHVKVAIVETDQDMSPNTTGRVEEEVSEADRGASITLDRDLFTEIIEIISGILEAEIIGTLMIIHDRDMMEEGETDLETGHMKNLATGLMISHATGHMTSPATGLMISHVTDLQ